MSNMEIRSYCIGIIRIAVAVYQTWKSGNLRKYHKTEAIELYSDTGKLLGSTQACLNALQAGNANLGIQEAGKAEGMAQALFDRSIKNIHHHFEFTRDVVNDWINNKKIHGT